MGWDTDLLKRFAEATHQKKAAAAAENKAKRIIGELDEPIRMMFAEEGVPSAKVVTEPFDADGDAQDVVLGVMQDVLTGDGDFGDVASAIVLELREKGLLVESTPKRTTTLFVSSRLWAKPVYPNDDPSDDEKRIARAAAVEALKANGFAAFVAEDFNMVSLSSAIKDAREEDESAIPLGVDFFDGAIEVKEAFQVGTRVKNG